MKRAEQKEKRRWEILEAALDLFIQKGFSATKTADIAKHAGMSEGLLFHYYESKERLYLALLELAASGPQQVLEDNQDCTPIQFFENAAAAILSYGQSVPLVAKLFVFVDQARHESMISEEMQASLERRDMAKKSLEHILKGQKNGTIREGDPTALMNLFWATIGAAMTNIARNPKDPHPKAEWIVDMLRNHGPVKL